MACTPSNIYGGFKQSMFMGLSVSSFSSSMDLAGNNTECTIRLVRDTCPSTDGKVYMDENAVLHLDDGDRFTDPDPGFTYPTTGSPCYFRVGGFEYSGLLQSYEEAEGSNGDVFVVKLVSPNEILQGAHVILEEYAGPVTPSGSPSPTPNLFNIFGYVEANSTLSVFCPLTTINGVQFGSPANKFGGSGVNHNGMPTAYIKQGLSILTSTINLAFPPFPTTANMYSPYGRLIFKGSDTGDVNFGVLPSDTTVSSVPKCLYLLDLSEVPIPSDIWKSRISGTPSIHDIVSEICSDGGYDWYCELLPTYIEDVLYKIIKIRTIYRYLQPDLGQIADFLSSLDTASGSPTSASQSIGLELRNEITSALIVGGPKESIYQSFNPDSEGNNNTLPYWGLKSNGDVIPTFTVTFSNGDADPNFAVVDKNVIGIDVDITGLRNTLFTTDFDSLDTIFITVDEIRAAAKGEDAWRALCFNVNRMIHGAGTIIDGGSGSYTINTFGSILYDKMPASIKLPKKDILKDIIDVAAGKRAFNLSDFMPFGKINNLNNVDKDADYIADIVKIYNFVHEFAEYYGKKFMVKMPYEIATGNSITAAMSESETDIVTTSEEPCESGWPEAAGGTAELSDVLGLTYPSQQLDFFINDSNKVECFVYFKYSNAGTIIKDYSFLSPDDFILYGEYLYVKATVETGHFVYDAASTYHSPRAVISISNPVVEVIPTGDPTVNCKLISDMADLIGYLLGDPGVVGKDLINKLKNKVSSQLLNINLDPRAYMPLGVALPIKSNVNNYGPWSAIGPPGQTKMEIVSSLVPWEYGSIANLNGAGNYTANATLTLMQDAEKGNITVPGFPTRSLGSELSHGAPFLLETRTSTNNTETITSGGLTYYGADVTPWTGLDGPNITSINCEVGPGGITTSYELRTYTPKYNRFGKLTLERYQKAGQRILKMNRYIRSQFQSNINTNAIRINKALRIAKNNAKAGGDPGNKRSPVDVIFGQLDKDTQSVSHISIGKTSESQNELSEDFNKKAIMSLDGLIRPIQKTSGSLPGYVNATNDTNIPHASRSPEPPLNPGVADNLDISTDFLDPFVGSGVGSSADRCTSGTHHDIKILGRGESPPKLSTIDDSMSLPLANAMGNSHYGDSDYRAFALRLPLMATGWCYDLDGKPTPNASDIAASGGTFVKEGLKDKFADNFMEKSELWPVAPIDLRYDRDRGVFTIPSSFRIVRAKITGENLTTSNTSSEAEIISSDGPPVYDEEGVEVPEKTITVWLPYINEDPAITSYNIPNPYARQNDIVVAYYNTGDNKYYAISVWQGGGSSGEVIRFKLTSDLTLGGTASAVILASDGVGGLVDGSAIMVDDFYNILPNDDGMFSGKVGFQGIAVFYGDIASTIWYDIIWMEGKARWIDFTVYTDPSTEGDGPYNVTLNTYHSQGVKPADINTQIPVHDQISIIKYSIVGAKGKAEYNDKLDRYDVVNVEQMVMFAKATLNATLCDEAVGGVAVNAIIPVKDGDFHLDPAPAITTAINPFKFKGENGDDVLLQRIGYGSELKWTIVNIERHTQDVLTYVSYIDGVLTYKKRVIAAQYCADETTAEIIIDPAAANIKSSYVITFELMEDLTDSGCLGNSFVAKILCSTAPTSIRTDVNLYPQSIYIYVKDTTGLFGWGVTGCLGTAIINYELSTFSNLQNITVGEGSLSVDTGFTFDILDCDQVVDHATASIVSDLCGAAEAQITDWADIPMGRHRFPMPVDMIPTSVDNPFAHGGRAGAKVLLMKQNEDWIIHDIQKTENEVITTLTPNSSCSLTPTTKKLFSELCADPAVGTPVAVSLPDICFYIYRSRCDTGTGTLIQQRAKITIAPCTGLGDCPSSPYEVPEENWEDVV